jgi:hypothetical protein
MTEYVTVEDRSVGPLEPDAVLPSQFFGALRRKACPDGERLLMVAVLEDAVHCYQKHVRASDPRGRQLFVDAEEWLMSTDRRWFFSFENVCETLGLDPTYVREGLVVWKEVTLRGRAAGSRVAEDATLRKASGA